MTKEDLVKLHGFIGTVNKVTAPHRHGIEISKTALDRLSNEQIEMEEFLAEYDDEFKEEV